MSRKTSGKASWKYISVKVAGEKLATEKEGERKAGEKLRDEATSKKNEC